MSGELHDISLAIGELRAETRESAVQRADIKRELKSQTGTLAEIKVAVDKIEGLHDRLSALEPVVTNLEKLRQRGIGVLWVVGLVSGAVGAALAALKAKVFAWLGWGP